MRGNSSCRKKAIYDSCTFFQITPVCISLIDDHFVSWHYYFYKRRSNDTNISIIAEEEQSHFTPSRLGR